MSLERLRELQEHLNHLMMMAEADVVRHDKGPTAEPTPEFIRARGLTQTCSKALKIVEQERFEHVGETAWLSAF